MEVRYEDEMNLGEYRRPKFTMEFVKANFGLDLDRNDDTDVTNWDGDSYIRIDIVETQPLIEIGDHIRIDHGYIPIDMKDADGNQDYETWYGFQLYFYGSGKVDLSLLVDGNGYDTAEDDGSYYELDPSPEEQFYICQHMFPIIKEKLDLDIAAELGWR